MLSNRSCDVLTSSMTKTSKIIMLFALPKGYRPKRLPFFFNRLFQKNLFTVEIWPFSTH